MKRFLQIASVIMLLAFAQVSKAQSYCTYNFGVSQCWATPTGQAINDITFGTFTELNSGCNSGAYNDQSSVNMTVSLGSSVPFTLATTGGMAHWGIWIDMDANGSFTDQGDVFWASTTQSNTVSGNIVMPASATVSMSRIRFKTTGDFTALTKNDACLWPFQTETQDFGITFNPTAGGCNIPTGQQAFPTATTALLTWDSVGTLYNVEYGTTGFIQGQGTTINPTTHSVTISSLLPKTLYDYYVQNDCSSSSGDSSSWNGPYTFITSCTPISSFPHTESFEDSDWSPSTGTQYTDTISPCWDRMPDVSGWSYSWIARSGPTRSTNTGPIQAQNGLNYMHVEVGGAAGAGAEAFLTSEQFNTTSLTSLGLSFYYHKYGVDMGTLYVEVSSDAGQTWNVVDSIVGETHNSDAAPWLPRTIDVSTYSSATFMYRFKGVRLNTSTRGDMAIDNVKLDVAPACIAPGAVAFSNVTGYTADVSWSSTESVFYIEYGPAGFVQGTGGVDTVNNAYATTLTGLAGKTTYDVYFMTDCSASGNGNSGWTGPYQFTTLLTPQFVEGFDDRFLPNLDWAEGRGLISDSTVFTSTSGSWTNDDWLNDNTPNPRNYCARYEYATFGGVGNSYGYWFFTEFIDLASGTDYELYFDMALTQKGNSVASNLEPDDSLHVVISTDGGLTWSRSNVLFTASDATNISNVGGKYIVDLTGYTGIIKLGFYAETNNPNPVASDLFIDNIGIRVAPPCTEPFALSVRNENAYDLTFGWTSFTGSTGYEVEYGPVGFAQGTGTKITGITADSVVVTGLTPVTEYNFYVRSMCSPDSSVWSGPAYGLTGCPNMFEGTITSTIDLLEVQEPPLDGYWDNCWWSSVTNTGKFRWKTGKGVSSSNKTGPKADHTTGVAGEGTYFYTESSQSGYDASIVLGPYDLTTLTDPTIEFYYHMFGSSMGELHLDVSLDNMNWYESQISLVGQQQLTYDEAWKKGELALSKFKNDTVYFRFRAIRGNNRYSDIAIDDVTVYATNGCVSPGGMVLNSRTTTSLTLEWGSYETSNTIEWGMTGFSQGSGIGTVVSGLSTPNYTISGLTPGGVYDVYIKDTCSTLGAWVGPYTFFTDCTGPLSGTYTVGGTGTNNFATLKEAVISLMNCGISGPVTINLTGGTHKGHYDFQEIIGASATNTVTINGTANDTIIAEGSDYAINLDGAGYITFNGLRVINNSTFSCFWLHNSAHDITIENNIIEAPVNTTDNAGVLASEISYDIDISGQNSFNIHVLNNEFYGGYASIRIYGDANNPTHGLVIDDNKFMNVYKYGIQLDGVDSVKINRNYMYDGRATFNGGAILTRVNEFEITGNELGGRGNSGLTVRSSNLTPVSKNSLIANNMFTGIANGDGLYIQSCNNIDIFHNTAIGEMGAYFTGSSDSENLDIRNNIFVGTNSFAFRMNSIKATTNYDYNVYYAQNGKNLASMAYTQYSDLAAWQAADANNNVNSKEGDPVFVSNTDLHVRGSIASDAGDNTVGITVDFDGETRPMAPSTTVDIGADEYSVNAIDASVTSVLAPANGTCGDSLMDVTVVIQNLGTTTLTATPVSVDITGDVTASVSYNWMGSLSYLEVDTVTVGTFNAYAGGDNIDVKAYTALTNDEDASNDTLATSIFIIAAEPEAGMMDTACYDPADSVTLYAKPQPGVVYNWYATMTDTVPTAQGDEYTISMGGQQNWYLGYQEAIADTFTTIGYTSTSNAYGGLMFDIVAKANMQITQFNLNSEETAGDTATLEVYLVPNSSYAGNEYNPGNWMLHETVSYVAAGAKSPSEAMLTNPIAISAGSRYAVYLVFRGARATATSNNSVQQTPLYTFEGGVSFSSKFTSVSSGRIFDGDIVAEAIVCSDERTMVSPIYNPDTAVADFTEVVTQPDKVDVDATNSTGHNISWDFGDMSQIVTGVTASHTYTKGGDYTVTCIVEDTVCNTVDTMTKVVNVTIGIDESVLAQSLTVYPNPNNGTFRVNFDIEGVKDVEIRVLDAVGRTVYSADQGTIAGSFETTVNISNESKGLYIVQVITNDNVVNKKITVQ